MFQKNAFNVAALIILFNHRCDNSDAVSSLYPQLPNSHIIIFDNGPSFEENKDICERHGWRYLSCNENIGLSKAYNCSIEFIKTNMPEVDIVLISDDDTQYPDMYIAKMTQHLNDSPAADIAVPSVISNNEIVSPSYIDSFGRVHSRQLHQGWTISAFNSGSMIRIEVFKHIQYNECLFLDCVDRDFYQKIASDGFRVLYCKSIEVNHRFSGFEKSTLEAKLHRFRLACRDLIEYSNLSYRYKLYFRCSLLYQAVALGFAYRTFAFFLLLIKGK